jgi:hypothetical protein
MNRRRPSLFTCDCKRDSAGLLAASVAPRGHFSVSASFAGGANAIKKYGASG